MIVDGLFRERVWGAEKNRSRDRRDGYQRDRARIIHSAAFRRLQAKTQVMGIGENDFHRTRLTHSLEVAQIGEGLLGVLKRKTKNERHWLPSRDLVISACLAHDIGHPPFGHRGEKVLHKKMLGHGGFEGNGQTLRIITKLEQYRPGRGINPTRRLVLAILKYPVPMKSIADWDKFEKPPKSYLDTERHIIDEILDSCFLTKDIGLFKRMGSSGKPMYRTLDSTIMEIADDIAYSVHDLEDTIARGLVDREQLRGRLESEWACFSHPAFGKRGGFSAKKVMKALFGSASDRKYMIGALVNLFVTSVYLGERTDFEHPLLRFAAVLPAELGAAIEALRNLTYKLVIEKPEIQQLEYRGEYLVSKLFDAFSSDPRHLIPSDAWESLMALGDGEERAVCDYMAGMTDTYAERVYQRLFVPGVGSARDEL